jgi:hypothetical protein
MMQDQMRRIRCQVHASIPAEILQWTMNRRTHVNVGKVESPDMNHTLGDLVEGCIKGIAVILPTEGLEI